MDLVEKQKRVDSYFDKQSEYYDYLHKTLGSGFKGESDKANGRVKIRGDWEFLSTIERRCNIRTIALKCMKKESVYMKIRSGSSYMYAVTNWKLFPDMVPVSYINSDSYGRKGIGYPVPLWKCNEVCTLIDDRETFNELVTL